MLNFFQTDSVDRSCDILVYGPSGTYKSRMIATLPDLERVFLISSTKGTLSLRHHKIDGCMVSKLADVKAALDFFREDKDKGRFDWICLDSASDIAEVIITEKLKKLPQLQAYNEAQRDMAEAIRDFRALTDRNIYMTAHHRLIEKTMSHLPAMPGQQLGPKLPYLFHEIFAMRSMPDEHGVERVVCQTTNGEGYNAKDESGALDLYEEPDLAQIVNKIKENN